MPASLPATARVAPPLPTPSRRDFETLNLMEKSAATGEELQLVDPRVWKASAGISARIAAVGSSVYYFPQGHADQASSLPDFSAVPCPRAYVRCRISSVRLHANRNTDEVFARISLDPRAPPDAAPVQPQTEFPFSSSSLWLPGAQDNGDGNFISFAKVLTRSDANVGGGFSVPRFCAESIFPPLDLGDPTPAQTVTIHDVHGKSWTFRHVYRGTPRRHLLTSGWSNFVNSKRLISGDSLVFMNSSGKVFVGIRRTSRSCGPATLNVDMEEKHGRFSRSVRGRVPPASVVEAVRLAGLNLPFEVMYYPSARSPVFVVPQEAVDAATRVSWTVGMRVRMSVETGDSARMNWFNGSVTKVTINDAGLWRRSPWGMLQITWDDPEVLQKVRDVSPWQVECFVAGPQGEIPHSIRNILDEQESSLLPDDKEDSELTGFKSRIIGILSPPVSNSSLFPVGMQGARHDFFHTASLFDSKSNGNQTFLNSVHGVNAPEKSDVPVEPSIQIPSQSRCSSPPRQGSIQALDRETLEPASNQVTKASIQLFGQVPLHEDSKKVTFCHLEVLPCTNCFFNFFRMLMNFLFFFMP
ncbi:unnamed protein product [Musa hybrid cultivar]